MSIVGVNDGNIYILVPLSWAIDEEDHSIPILRLIKAMENAGWSFSDYWEERPDTETIEIWFFKRS